MEKIEKKGKRVKLPMIDFDDKDLGIIGIVVIAIAACAFPGVTDKGTILTQGIIAVSALVVGRKV